MEKATYSLSALKQCKELIRKNRWSTRLKAEHNSRCAEVNVLFASCQKLLNYVMFQPDLSPAYDYQQMVLSKSCTKKQLDNQLRVCHASAKKSLVSFTGKHDPKSALPFHVIQHNNSHPWCASFPLRKSGVFCCRSFGNNSVVYRCRSPPPFDLPVNNL